jgi:hypothetical protein
MRILDIAVVTSVALAVSLTDLSVQCGQDSAQPNVVSEATLASLPLLTEPGKLQFADHFSPGQVSERWFFSKDWSAENGVLQRVDSGGDNT